MPRWFQIFLGLFAFLLVTMVIRRLSRFTKRIIFLPKDKRERLTHSRLTIIKINKIMFILSPVYLIIIPLIFYAYRSYQDFIYTTVMFILLYIIIFEDFMFSKSILKEIKEIEANELNSRPQHS